MTAAAKELHVFVVEDDAYFNELLTAQIKRILDQKGIEAKITRLYSKEECLANIDQQPDLVFLDFYLDVNNDIMATGYDVLEKIKKKYPEIRVVIISAQHDWERFKDEFLEFGAEDFVKKDDQLEKNLSRFLTVDQANS
jgi:CheY-like chemotaxis protein